MQCYRLATDDGDDERMLSAHGTAGNDDLDGTLTQDERYKEHEDARSVEYPSSNNISFQHNNQSNLQSIFYSYQPKQPPKTNSIKMRFSTAAASLAAVVATASASSVLVINKCPETLYLTAVDQSGKITGQPSLTSGGTYQAAIVGQGNSLGIAKNSDYYSPNTPKIILGTSTANNVLYWSVSSVNGDPFSSSGQKFTVASPSGSNPNACGAATGPDGQVHGCQDNNVLLTFTACA